MNKQFSFEALEGVYYHLYNDVVTYSGSDEIVDNVLSSLYDLLCCFSNPINSEQVKRNRVTRCAYTWLQEIASLRYNPRSYHCTSRYYVRYGLLVHALYELCLVSPVLTEQSIASLFPYVPVRIDETHFTIVDSTTGNVVKRLHFNEYDEIDAWIECDRLAHP